MKVLGSKVTLYRVYMGECYRVLNLAVTGLCLRINGFIAQIGLTALSLTYFIRLRDNK